MVLFKLLPDLLPETFGPAENPWSAFGMWLEQKQREGLPNGIGHRPLEVAKASFLPNPERGIRTPIEIVVAQCSLCHTGRVRSSEGTIHDIEGAPGNTIRVAAFQSAMYGLSDTLLAAPSEAHKKIMLALMNKPLGWLYGDSSLAGRLKDKAQRELFRVIGRPILSQLSSNLKRRASGFESYSRHVYSQDPRSTVKPPLEHLPGMADAFGSIPAFYPEKVSVRSFGGLTDIPSVWNQGARSNGQWAGDVGSRFLRNALAALLLVTDVKRVDIPAVAKVDRFLDVWAPPPYPFSVDIDSARRGSQLYASDCAECHVYNHRGETVPRLPEVATDPLRALFFDKAPAAVVADMVREACPPGRSYKIGGRSQKPCDVNPSEAYAPQGDTPGSEVGYIAPHHDGLWARSPLLHNGSVPTIRHLLVPKSRPKSFMRGTVDYDQDNLGFVWKIESVNRKDNPDAFQVETRWQGLSNQGHDTVLKRDWGQHPDELQDLIEFLKTL